MSTNIRDLVPAPTDTTPSSSSQSTTAKPTSSASTTTFAAALKTATGGTAAPGSSATATIDSSSPAQEPARPTGEQLQAVPDAPYAKILTGAQAGLYLNQAPGNPREGEAFHLEHRDGRDVHVYGSGADELVEIIPPATSADPTGATTAPVTSTPATTTPATSTGGTSSGGTSASSSDLTLG